MNFGFVKIMNTNIFPTIPIIDNNMAPIPVKYA